MAINGFPLDKVSSEPVYSGRETRQVLSALVGGATTARPLGGRSGVRPGTPTTTVATSAGNWTVARHAGVLDVQSAVEAGVYYYANDATTAPSAITAANATNPRRDIVYVKLDDPAESDGSSVPAVTFGYLAGTAAASPVAPAAPARSMILAVINVPNVAGGGASSATVTWSAPYAYAAGAIIRVRTVAERNLVTSGTAENPELVDVASDGVIYRSVGSGWVPVSSQGFFTNARSAAYSMGTNSTMFNLGGSGSSYPVFGVPESHSPLTLASNVYSNDMFSWNQVTGILTPVLSTGLYELEFRAETTPQTGGTVTIGITKNTASISATSNDLARDDHVNTSAAKQYLYAKTGPVRLTSADQIRFISFIFGASGAVTIGTDPGQTWFTIRRVGA